MKKIILTGGGTAGHVTPNLALLPSLRDDGYEIHYAGGFDGIERELAIQNGLTYHGISAGKLRRYLDVKNITDIFRVAKGFADAVALIRRVKPDVVFSKGGFVTVPVAAAAWICGVPLVAHESDITPGLANRLALPFAARICVNFPETLAHLPSRKSVLTGSPIRQALFSGNRFEAERYCRFASEDNRPVLLFTGGSLGAAAINHALRSALPRLCADYKVIHLCGKGNLSDVTAPGYVQIEYANEELPHLLALADIVISRAGANTLFELLALKKPNLLIPLPKESSRGDQILNAASFERQGFSMVLPEARLTAEALTEAIQKLYAGRGVYIANMTAKENTCADGVKNVMRVIRQTVRGK